VFLNQHHLRAIDLLQPSSDCEANGATTNYCMGEVGLTPDC